MRRNHMRPRAQAKAPAFAKLNPNQPRDNEGKFAEIPGLSASEYHSLYGDVLDEATAEDDGDQIAVRIFENGDAHLVTDHKGGKHQVWSELDSPEAMRQLSYNIRDILAADLDDDDAEEDEDGVIAWADNYTHGLRVGRYATGDVAVRDENGEGFDIGEDQADELAAALEEMSDSYDNEFESEETAMTNVMPQNHPGHPDQSVHGRRRKGVPAPDMPQKRWGEPDAPIANPRPAPAPAPKPRRRRGDRPTTRRAAPAKTAGPMRRKDVPRLSELTEYEADRWYSELGEGDWKGFTPRERQAVSVFADRSWEDGSNRNLVEIVRELEDGTGVRALLTAFPFNHPGHPDQSVHGRPGRGVGRRRGGVVPNAPGRSKGPDPSKAKPPSSNDGHYKHIPDPGRGRSGSAAEHEEMVKLPGFSRLGEEGSRKWLEQLSPADWRKLTPKQRKRVHDIIDELRDIDAQDAESAKNYTAFDVDAAADLDLDLVPDWFSITNKADLNLAQVHIYNDIGGFNGINAEAFCGELANLNVPTIEVRLNSRGGDVFEGIAIHNALLNHPAKVRVEVDGVAASIASIIAMAGDEVVMHRGSQMMIHEGHSSAAGTAKDMQNQANLLNKVSDELAAFYARKAGGTVAEWRGRMEKETWYTAEEAVQAGLADRLASHTSAKNQFDFSCFNYAGRENAPAPNFTDAAPVAPAARTRMIPPATKPAQRVPQVPAATKDQHWAALAGPVLTAPSTPDAAWTAFVEGIK